MDMEGIGTEELVGGIAKGKRTKRLRLLSSNCGGGAAMTCSSSSANSGDHATADYGSSFSSTTTAYESSDQEEEDMANCLILLAQGRADSDQHHRQKNKAQDNGVANINKTEKVSNSSRKFAEMATPTATATATKVGFYIYECKTCNRTFPSFQALGGHRASHKKPKITAEEKKPPPSPPQQQVITNYEEAGQAQIKIGPPISLQLGSPQNHRSANNKANKVHECSICGSEFTSGQALGGHMRRHRASSTNTTTNTQLVGIKIIDGIHQSTCRTTPAATPTPLPEVQPRNILQLDLNLPAPEDDLPPDSKFQFTATKKSSMVLSAAPTLVGCHY